MQNAIVYLMLTLGMLSVSVLAVWVIFRSVSPDVPILRLILALSATGAQVVWVLFLLSLIGRLIQRSHGV